MHHRTSFLRSTAILHLFLLFTAAQAQPTAADFDAALNAHFTADAPGGAVLVAQGGKVVYERAVGLADLKTGEALSTASQFRIGSVTKQFTAVAILQLADAGKLKLEDEIQQYIDFPRKDHPITVEHLLLHTSGIPSFTSLPVYTAKNYAEDISLKEIIALFSELPLEFEPGTQWSYSNSGYLLLTAIVEEVSGQSWTDYTTQHLFVPAGMVHSSASTNAAPLAQEAVGYAQRDSGWVVSDPISLTWPRGAGCIRSTVGDLWKWNSSVMSGRQVPLQWLERAHSPYTLPDGSSTAYGYGWGFKNVQGIGTIEHNGGIDGFISASLYVPEHDIYVAVLTNKEAEAATILAPQLAAIAMGKPYGGEALPLDETLALDYTGVYLSEKEVLRYITADKQGLHAQREGSRMQDLEYLGNDVFRYAGDLILLHFQRDQGRVTRARFDSRDGSEQLTRTYKPLPAPRVPIPLQNAALQAYVGEYELAPGFILSFRAEGDRFFGRATGQDEFEVFGDGPHSFFLTVVDATVLFHPEADGSVRRITFNQGGAMEGKRVK
jgi:CubicO group peptidase (beta-lactamase class C family)